MPTINNGAGIYDVSEQEELLEIFKEMLKGPTVDGGRKRAKLEKPSWKIDETHADALMRHLHNWEMGDLADEDSGVHPLIHAAWRALALAYQENEEFLKGGEKT